VRKSFKAANEEEVPLLGVIVEESDSDFEERVVAKKPQNLTKAKMKEVKKEEECKKEKMRKEKKKEEREERN